MKWPFVLRSTMDAAVKRHVDANAQTIRLHQVQIANIQKDIDNKIFPVCEQLTSVKVSQRAEELNHEIFFTIDDHMLRSAREFPERAMDAVGRYLGQKITREIERSSSRMRPIRRSSRGSWKN